MARTASALKAHRASIRRSIRNHRRRSAVERLLREYRKPGTPSPELARTLQQALDKAAGRNVLHHRTVARIKSRLSRRAPVALARPKTTKVAKKD